MSVTTSADTDPDIVNAGKNVAVAISQALVPSNPLTFGPF